MSQTEQQIIISGNLLSITLFEEKLMRNFYIINSKLKKLEGVREIQGKMRNMEKELKFLTTKVDSLVEKVPKDGVAVNKKQVIAISKEQFFQIFNNPQEKIKQTETFKALLADIDKIKADLKATSKATQNFQIRQIPAKQNSFTAGTILLSESKKPPQASKQILNEVLTKEENHLVNQIMSSDHQVNQFQKMKHEIQNLYDSIDNLKMIVGRGSFVQREINEYDRHERDVHSKSQIEGKKRKSHNKLNPNLTVQEQQKLQDQKNGEIKRVEFSLQTQKNHQRHRLENNIQGKSQTIIKQDLISRKLLNQQLINQQVKTPNTLLNKDQLSGVFINSQNSNEKNVYSTTQPHFNKNGELTKVEYIPENKLVSKAQRAKSLKKLQRVEKKLRVDDTKDLNSVLKEIQLRLQSKANQDLFIEYVRQIEQRLEILRITKDQTNEISDLRRMIYNLDTKMQSVIGYLQAITNEDDALIVKKNWTCISCDKMVEKFSGKVGQHLNWDSIQAKKISPTKIGAFGQAGQIASKIKNFIENGQ